MMDDTSRTQRQRARAGAFYVARRDCDLKLGRQQMSAMQPIRRLISQRPTD